jgi:hypothetical protein
MIRSIDKSMARFKHSVFDYEYDTELDVLIYDDVDTIGFKGGGSTEPLLTPFEQSHKNYFYLLENNRIEIDDDYVDEDMNFFVNCLISKLARDGIKAEKINDMIDGIRIQDNADYALFLLKYHDFIHYD